MNPEVVYESLREELLGAYTRQEHLVAFSFTATVALIGYGFTRESIEPLIFLLPLLILWLLIVQLNNTTYTIFTISIYIRLFIERPHSIPKWETNIGFLRSYLRLKKPFKSLRPYNPVIMFDGWLYALVTAAMGIVCVFLFWLYGNNVEKWVALISAAGWTFIVWLYYRPLAFVNSGDYEQQLEKVWGRLERKGHEENQ